MDPISVIVAALAAGAGAGIKDSVSRTVQDAYGGLRELVRRRLAVRPGAATVLAEHETAPHRWQESLSAELVAVDAGSDQEIITAARQVLALIGQAGHSDGGYRADARGAQGVQVGNDNTQSNIFTTPPAW